MKFVEVLSPRRKAFASRLIEYLVLHGMKIILSNTTFAEIDRETGMDKAAIRQAVDDLYSRGIVGVGFGEHGDEVVHVVNLGVL